jgi:uncharacterized membrane protein YhaH (DUF805 family)
MTFSEAVRTCFRKYADFTGRASRPEYWWFFLSYVLLYFAALIVDAAIGSPFFVLLVGLGYFLPMLAAGVRRLHDTGRSGWWLLVSLVPIVGGIILLVLLASAGEPGPNRYGPPPGEVPARPDSGTVPPPPA